MNKKTVESGKETEVEEKMGFGPGFFVAVVRKPCLGFYRASAKKQVQNTREKPTQVVHCAGGSTFTRSFYVEFLCTGIFGLIHYSHVKNIKSGTSSSVHRLSNSFCF